MLINTPIVVTGKQILKEILNYLYLNTTIDIYVYATLVIENLSSENVDAEMMVADHVVNMI